MNPSDIEYVIRLNIQILLLEGFLNKKTKDPFFSDCIADRNGYIIALLVEDWEKIDRRCFIDGNTIQLRSAGIFLYMMLMVSYGCSWGEIYCDPVVNEIMEAEELSQIGILQIIIHEHEWDNKEPDPIMIRLLSDLANSKCPEVKEEAINYIMESDIMSLKKPLLN